jgi:predicted dehydrogenase
MAIEISPEEKAVGKDNFNRAVGKLAEQPSGVNRRQFMKGLIAAGAGGAVGAAAYFGYSTEKGKPAAPSKPLQVALVGAGDEGGVLVGEHNPDFLEFVALCDIRPSNRNRIFEGDEVNDPKTSKKVFNVKSPRLGFKRIPAYGKDARKKIKVFHDYHDLLKDADTLKKVEAVVIALPLHLHAPAAIAFLEAGKHVLCEKLMAWNITQCKDMIRAARKNDRILAIGHQRHYSMLYAHAVEVLKSGILGDINHIRALWHRNNTQYKLGDKKKRTYEGGWRPPIRKEDEQALRGLLEHLDYKDIKELVRWRLYQRTGGGLMAELGSHQLDACRIFLRAIGQLDPGGGGGEKVRPLAVTAIGGKYFYDDDSEVEDHIFCTYEFPGKAYDPKKSMFKDGKAIYNDVVAVTYSSINTNAFEPYGEVVMGSSGTMVIESERDVMLFGKAAKRSTAMTVTEAAGGKPVLDTSASTDPTEQLALQTGQKALGLPPPSRGYREEMEHFAFIIRNREEGTEEDRKKLKPRCDGPAAMADAIIALTATKSMEEQRRIVFEPNWFDPDKPDVPDKDKIPTDRNGKPAKYY